MALSGVCVASGARGVRGVCWCVWCVGACCVLGVVGVLGVLVYVWCGQGPTGPVVTLVCLAFVVACGVIGERCLWWVGGVGDNGVLGVLGVGLGRCWFYVCVCAPTIRHATSVLYACVVIVCSVPTIVWLALV